jgi:hypothetical protein
MISAGVLGFFTKYPIFRRCCSAQGTQSAFNIDGSHHEGQTPKGYNGLYGIHMEFSFCFLRPEGPTVSRPTVRGCLMVDQVEVFAHGPERAGQQSPGREPWEKSNPIPVALQGRYS